MLLVELCGTPTSCLPVAVGQPGRLCKTRCARRWRLCARELRLFRRLPDARIWLPSVSAALAVWPKSAADLIATESAPASPLGHQGGQADGSPGPGAYHGVGSRPGQWLRPPLS